MSLSLPGRIATPSDVAAVVVIAKFGFDPQTMPMP
jgi:hypothetical protein